MLKPVDIILENCPYDVFTDTELVELISGTDASRYNKLKRAIAHKEIIQIRRGLYQLAKRYQRRGLNLYELANKIYGPSYVSFESALSYHGLIPEAVYSVVSASAKRACEFNTLCGVFAYSQIPIRVFYEGVERIEKNGFIFLIASPLKAITDYVYTNKLNWVGIQPLIESLRIEKEDLKFELKEINELKAGYSTARISRFLTGLERDLKL